MREQLYTAVSLEVGVPAFAMYVHSAIMMLHGYFFETASHTLPAYMCIAISLAAGSGPGGGTGTQENGRLEEQLSGLWSCLSLLLACICHIDIQRCGVWCFMLSGGPIACDMQLLPCQCTFLLHCFFRIMCAVHTAQCMQLARVVLNGLSS